MKALFYDTETSGLPLFSEPSEDPRQPHIVQLGACLVDLETSQQIASLDVIVPPLRQPPVRQPCPSVRRHQEPEHG